MPTIQPNLNLQAFTAAAQQLGEGATIRLKNDGRGIATATWDRFVVRVVDLFSSAATVQTKELQARTAFLSAIKNEHGPNFQKDFSDYGVGTKQLGAGAVRLDARVVSGYAASASERGGQHWMSNEISIKAATDHSRVASLIASTTDRILAEAVHLTNDEKAEFRVRMTAHGSPAGISNLASTIESELRSAARVAGADGRVGNNLLDTATVRTLADRAITQALCNTVNRPMFNDQRYIQDLIGRARDAGLHDFANKLELIDEIGSGERPSMNLGKSLRKPFTERAITFPTLEQMHILKPTDVEAMMAAGLDAAIARQRQKLDQIATLLPGVPLDNSTRRLLEQHFSEGSSKISNEFLVAVQAALNIPLPQADEINLRNYATAIERAISQAGVSDFGARADFLYALVCLDQARGRNGISAMVNDARLTTLVKSLNDAAEDALDEAAMAQQEPNPADVSMKRLFGDIRMMEDITREIGELPAPMAAAVLPSVAGALGGPAAAASRPALADHAIVPTVQSASVAGPTPEPENNSIPSNRYIQLNDAIDGHIENLIRMVVSITKRSQSMSSLDATKDLIETSRVRSFIKNAEAAELINKIDTAISTHLARVSREWREESPSPQRAIDPASLLSQNQASAPSSMSLMLQPVTADSITAAMLHFVGEVQKAIDEDLPEGRIEDLRELHNATRDYAMSLSQGEYEFRRAD